MSAYGPGNAGTAEVVRHLRLRGGALDGGTWSGVIGIGKRVFCGSEPWSPEFVYVVTDSFVTGSDGLIESVAVPASF